MTVKRLGDHERDFELVEVEIERYELHEPRHWSFALEPIDRRVFMRVFTAVGGGLLVAATAPPGLAQESGRGGQQSAPRDVAAWLHIDEQGRITGYTGKTEIGQNIRTSLAQAIADELHVPPQDVTLIMADTDRVPFDQGTFGSLSTPRMAPQLGRAAAAAREILIGRAASLLHVDRTALSTENGRITGGPRAITFAELVRGQKLAGAIGADVALMPASDWRSRGRPLPKRDGRDFVTGHHRYTPDVTRPGMLFGRVMRSEGYGGTVVSVDDTAARGQPGVTIVRDGDFIGVVAPTDRAARNAAAAMNIEWRLPAGHPTSSTIYEHLKRSGSGAGGRGATPIVQGDPSAARAAASRIFDASYRIPYIAHVPLEPRCAVAEWTDGKLTVWTGTQRPFGVRAELAEAFKLPEERVRVIVPDTGSAYGGKHSGEYAVEAARLAKAAARPVKLVWTRRDEFSYGYFRPAGVIDIRAAVDRSGRISAWEFDNWNSGASAIRTPYTVASQRIQFHPSESPLRQGSYRGLAATANHYAREMHMDTIARALGTDAVAFRLAHLDDPRLRAVLEAAARAAGWPKASAEGRALGIACGTEKGSYVATAAEVAKTDAGFNVERLVVAFECGAIVNPDGLKNQVEGAVVQGLGGALFERIEFGDGRIQNGTMAQYRVPRFRDVPAIEIVLLDRRDLPSAGAGETPIVCVAPAIGSAARAFGEVAEELPVRIVRRQG